MNIFFPIGFFYPNQNGPGNSVYWLAKSLLQQNVKVTEIAMDKDIPFSIPRNKWLETDYGVVKYVKTQNYVLGLKYVWLSFLQSKKGDVTHLNSIFAPTSFLIGFLITFFRRKVCIVWSIRGELSPHALAIKTNIKKIMLFALKQILNRRITFHATCEEEKQYIQQVFGEKAQIIMIPNLLKIPDYSPIAKKNYILYLGRIHHIKALEELIYALKLSPCFLTQDFTLCLSGDDDNVYGQKLRQIIKNLDLQEHVEFTGHVGDSVKQELLAGARCLILPSHSENFGNVVVEALAQKTPVIASKGTPWQILETSNAGFWVENTPEKLALAIDRMLGMSESDYEKMCENAFNLVKSEFEIEKNIHRWITAYNGLLVHNA